MSVGARKALLGVCLFTSVIASANRAGAMLGGQLVQNQQGVEQSIVGFQLLDQFGKMLSPCAGVMLRADAILTAGHCADASFMQTLVSIRVVRATNLNSIQDDNSETRQVRRVYPHVNYNSKRRYEGKTLISTFDHDLAVVFLDRSLNGPIPSIRFPNAAEVLTPGTPLMVYGYGMLDDSKKSDEPGYGGAHYRELQRGAFVLGSEKSYDRLMTTPDSRVGLCYGDSGGPGFLVDKNMNPLPIVATVNSATSLVRTLVKGKWVTRCRGEAVLQPIAPYVSWIQDVLRREGIR